MKKLSMILSVLCISILVAVPAFAQLAYQLDVGQNGSFETGGFIDLGVSESVTVDIYVSGYACSPDNDLFGTKKFILLDESKVSVSGFAYDTSNGGPWDSATSIFSQREPNVYKLETSDFGFVTVVGGIQKLGTMTLTGTADGCFTMRVANDLTSFGYGSHNNGAIADCNLAFQYPADAVLNVAVGTVAETDGDGVADCFDNCPVHPNGPSLGTCVTTKAGMTVSYRVGNPKDYITCTSDADCAATGGTCQMEQGDCNENGVGDAGECYANFNYPTDLKINSSDLSKLKLDFGRIDCSTPPVCSADGNNDGKVNSSDLGLLKNEFGRIDCPALP